MLATAPAACAYEVGPGCPTDLVAEPNGREQHLFFVGGGYVQDGLWKQLTIPRTVTPDAFTVTTGTIVFHEPSCVTGPSGFPLFDADGNLQCEFDVDTSTSSNSCRLPPVEQDLDDTTVETTSIGTNVVLDVQKDPELAIKVGCDLSLTGGLSDPKCATCKSGVHVVVRQSDGAVRYEDTIWVTCDRATGFFINYVGLLGMSNGLNAGDGTVHVGDEFVVRYTLTSSDTSRYPSPMGNGMVPVDANPAFEIVAYRYPIGAQPQLHLRALAPADHPHLKAGAIEAALPVTIVP